MQDAFQHRGFILGQIAFRLLLQNIEHVDRMPAELQPNLRLALNRIGALPNATIACEANVAISNEKLGGGSLGGCFAVSSDIENS